jgi:leader peptidase (prepilin peptidase)/N-methyltransferase
MDILIQIYVAAIGLVFGSFLNVIIYRTPLKQSVIKGNSYCPKCGHKLKWVDLFPVISYIFLFGKCRYCKQRINPRYPIVEAVNAICYILIFNLFGINFSSLIYAVICSSLIALALIDFDHKIIPNRFHLIIGSCAVILGFLNHHLSWLDRIIGMFVISLPLLVVALITGGIGEGDIKLFAVCGLLLGWKVIILSMIIASVSASAYGIGLMAMKKAKGKTEIPFGPFIAFSVIICLLFGEQIIKLYFSVLI